MTKPDRIPCVVPGCRRTAPKEKYPPGTLIMCGKHWRGLTIAERAEFRAAQRVADEIAERLKENPFSPDIGVGEALRQSEAIAVIDRLWNLAIERACGL